MRLSGVDVNELTRLARAIVAADADLPAHAEIPPRPLCFGLVGTLGAGKTRLCQEIAQAWGIDPAEVTSPTFTLLKSYELTRHRPALTAPRQLHHLDLYRVVDEDELWELGVDELWETPGSWTLIEWADRFADSMPANIIWIRIEISDDPLLGDPDEPPLRAIELQSADERGQQWLQDVESRLAKASRP